MDEMGKEPKENDEKKEEPVLVVRQDDKKKGNNVWELREEHSQAEEKHIEDGEQTEGDKIQNDEKIIGDEDIESDISESSISDLDDERSSPSEIDDDSKIEVPLTDSEIEGLIAEFLEVESKAAEAQESLEKESLAQVESEVRSELAEILQGDDLEKAVFDEMVTFKEEWERTLDDLETESALLLEQLDGAGIELPSLYKWIENQAPNGCCTEAWKKRAHWVGSQSSSEVLESIKDAENYLQSCRPLKSNKKRRKRKIRRILDDAELGEETKKKIAIEKERQEHLKSMQFQSSSKTWSRNLASYTMNVIEGDGVELLGDATMGYIVNVAREKDEEPVRIPPSMSAKLKPHQVAGIRFMWENIIQSLKKVKSGDKGLGCILAHTMGLGKTFQVIALLYTAMRRIDLGLRTAIVVTPVNVLHNWRQEFVKWQPIEVKQLRVFMLEDVSREKRVDLLAKWRRKGGVLLIGYTAFRNLSLGRHVKDRNVALEICNALQNGPDILVCDEAHMIKNTRADITHALKQVNCQRRIALTGSPLQNNLMEYYCMVDFVREGFLGSSHEFRNRFQNPIQNGQHTNSTSDDVKIMNQRSHILYEQLKGFVQRMDMNVVKKDLPPKIVYVITVKLSPLQRTLYKRFLDVHGFRNGQVSCDRSIRNRCFFSGYQALAQIWNHPGLLQLAKEHKDSLRREDRIENFMDEDSSSDENMERDIVSGADKLKNKNDWTIRKNGSNFFHEFLHLGRHSRNILHIVIH